jgi:RNA polymerase sigma-70 factor (ECF subfamily)
MSIATATAPSGIAVTQEFEDLFNEHAQLVYRTAYGVTGSHEDAEDVLQTIFLRLMRRNLPPDLGRSPQAYLYRAAVNQSLETLRLRKRHTLVDAAALPDLPVPPVELVDNTPHRRLYRAIAELKPETAQILILRYVHGKSDAEIAGMLGMSRGAIALRLFRSRARLKKLLGDRLGEAS